MVTAHSKRKRVPTDDDDDYIPHKVSGRKLVTAHDDEAADYEDPQPAASVYAPPLQQFLYKSYTGDIQLYHFKGTKEQVTKFQKKLTREEHGLIETRLGDDTMASQPHADGDEIPEDCVEVAYLPKIFHKKAGGQEGSALGFRVGGNHIEWMCFDRAVDEAIFKNWAVISDVHTPSKYSLGPINDPKEEDKLFDFVAVLPKGIDKGVRDANVEHRLWYGSLASAEVRPFKLKLTWKGKGRDYKETLEQNKLIREAHHVQLNVNNTPALHSGFVQHAEQVRIPLPPNNGLQQAGAGPGLQSLRSAYESQSGQRHRSILKMPTTSSTPVVPQRRISWANEDTLEQVRTFTRDSIIADGNTDAEDMDVEE